MKNFSEYFNELSYTIAKLDYKGMEEAYQIAKNCRTLYIFGNGGSAAVANHWVCDFAKGINEDTTRTASAVSLSCNVPLITAIANDIGYEHVFSKQLEYMRPTEHDAVFAVSSSGNSKNIVNGLTKARELGLRTVAFTGFHGGAASAISDVNVHVPAHNYGIVEDMHMMILHGISQRIRWELAKDQTSIKL